MRWSELSVTNRKRRRKMASLKVWVVVDQSGDSFYVSGAFSSKKEAEKLSDSQEGFCGSRVIEATLYQKEQKDDD
jgi:hypothetical protein